MISLIEPKVFKLDIEKLKEILVNRLLRKGFIVKESYKAKGFSGVIHEFDILIEEGGRCCAINFCRSDATIELIKAVALYLDTKIPQIVVCNEYKKDIVEMIEGSNVKVSMLSNENIDEVIRKIVEYLKEHTRLSEMLSSSM